MTGISKENIADIEDGHRIGTRISTLLRLCAALRIPIGHLFDDQAVALTRREWQSLEKGERTLIDCYRILDKKRRYHIKQLVALMACEKLGKKKINFAEYAALPSMPMPELPRKKELIRPKIHHSAETKAEAMRRMLEEGVHYRDVAAQMDISPKTTQCWLLNYKKKLNPSGKISLNNDMSTCSEPK